ncbi:hypothetical protein ACIQ7Q_34290 [Streptomyces sp. NPDC096176]|uniref:hypothetical protein n=1 Tax=Streptomyces sp. NPDC096176 TaxID=3366079 RepID=UPI0037F39CDF
MLRATNTTWGGEAPYSSLAKVVRQLARVQDAPRAKAHACNTTVRAALLECVRGHDEAFSLNLRVAPVRQGPAGVAAYLLHESDRLSQLTLSMPRTRGLRLHDEAAWTSLVFLRHTAQEVSRICRRSTPDPHLGGRLTLFDRLPRQALHGLAPVAVSMSHVHSAPARWARLHRAEESGLLTDAEQAVIDSQTSGHELRWFIQDTKTKRRWTAPLWPALMRSEEVLAAPSWDTEPPLTEQKAVIDALEAEAAHTADVDVAELALLRSRMKANDAAALTAKEQRALRLAAVKLQRRATTIARQNPENRPATLLDTYITIAREASDRFTADTAVSILDACDEARESLAQRAAARAASQDIRGRLPDGKLQPMCEIDYLGHVREQVRLALGPIEHVVQSKRIVVINASTAADTALCRLNEAFGGTCVPTATALGAAIRIPPPSQFGVRRLRARTCDCGRHTTGPMTHEDAL